MQIFISLSPNCEAFLWIPPTDPAVGHCRSGAFQEVHGAALLPQRARRCLCLRCHQRRQLPQPPSMDWGVQAARSGLRGSQDPRRKQVWSPRLRSSGDRGGAAVCRHPLHAPLWDICKELKYSEGWNSGPRKQRPRGGHFYDSGSQVAISEASGVEPAGRRTRGVCQSEQPWGQPGRRSQELGLQRLLRGIQGWGWGLHSQAAWNSRVRKYQMAFNEYCFD